MAQKVLEHSEAIVLRDPISEKYVRDFVPDKTISLTLDSAFQHDVNIEQNKEKLNQYMELKRFLEKHEKCVGVTITDLLWHPVSLLPGPEYLRQGNPDPLYTQA